MLCISQRAADAWLIAFDLIGHGLKCVGEPMSLAP